MLRPHRYQKHTLSAGKPLQDEKAPVKPWWARPSSQQLFPQTTDGWQESQEPSHQGKSLAHAPLGLENTEHILPRRQSWHTPIPGGAPTLLELPSWAASLGSQGQW